jgi:hypothetical protein
MILPGFTSNAALYKTSGRYLMYTDARSGTYKIHILPQRSIVCDIQFEHCVDRCERFCRFDEAAEVCGECYGGCVSDNIACESIFSPPPTRL